MSANNQPDATIATPRHRRSAREFWFHEAAYLVILLLAVGGAGYVSMTRRPIVHYWDFVAIVVAALSIVIGWREREDAPSRWRLVWTQVLHWGAFLAVMNLVFLPSIQGILNANSTSLTVLLLLALGTFVSGVHTASPLMCANGVLMALAVPAIAWLDQSALLIALALVVVAALTAAILWYRSKASG